MESGEGLRVVNRTGAAVNLVLASGASGPIAAGKFVILVMPCRERFPVRAEQMSGELIGQFTGPCRRRDTWTLN